VTIHVYVGTMTHWYIVCFYMLPTEDFHENPRWCGMALHQIFFLRNFRRKCLSEKIVPEVHGSLLGFPLKCPFILAGHFPHKNPALQVIWSWTWVPTSVAMWPPDRFWSSDCLCREMTTCFCTCRCDLGYEAKQMGSDGDGVSVLDEIKTWWNKMRP
jgi:hypothetical protein